MTTTEGDGRVFRLDRAGELLGVLGLAGLGAFAVCYSYERAFYNVFGLEPENGGQGYSVIVARAASGGLLVVALLGAAAAGPFGAALLRGRISAAGPAVRRAAEAVAAAAAGFIAAVAAFAAAGQGLASSAAVGGSFAALAGVLSILRPSGPAGSRVFGRGAAVVAVVALLLAVARAWDAGSDDGRRLLGLGDARAAASVWQQWLGVPTPAVTAVWTEPGASAPIGATVRLLGVDGGAAVVFDLDACVLRRVPAGELSTRSIVGGHGTDGLDDEPSPVPRCPRRP